MERRKKKCRKCERGVRGNDWKSAETADAGGTLYVMRDALRRARDREPEEVSKKEEEVKELWSDRGTFASGVFPSHSRRNIRCRRNGRKKKEDI